MQSAKEHVSKFLHGSGKHTAELTSQTNAPITHETVKRTEEEQVHKAVDREVHEDHYQTEVLPVHDRDVRATEHHHNVLPVEQRQQHHGRDHEVKEKLGQIAGSFANKKHVEDTQHVQGGTSEIVGEHHHHHVHHTVQPVIKKETIQPHVVHTTVPVHERVDLEPTVHSATVAPALTMDQFKQHVGVGGANKSETVNYTGDPLHINKDEDVGFLHGGKHINPSSHHDRSTGLAGGTVGGSDYDSNRQHTSTTSGGGMLGGILGGNKDHDSNRRHDSSSSNSSGGGGGGMLGGILGGNKDHDSNRRHDNTTSGSSGGMLGGIMGGNNRDSDRHHTGTGTGTGSSAGAMAAATAATGQHRGTSQLDPKYNNSDNPNFTSDRDHHQKDHGLLGSSTHGQDRTGTSALGSSTHDGTDRRMPGEFVQDSGHHSGTSNVPRTAGSSGLGAGGTASNPTGMIDGRSPNDHKDPNDTSEKGGVLSGLMNKLKS